MSVNVNPLRRATARQDFFNRNMKEIAKKKIELKDDKEKFDTWYDEEFQKYVKEEHIEDLFVEVEAPTEEVKMEEVKEEDIPPALLTEPEVITVEDPLVLNGDKSDDAKVTAEIDSLSSKISSVISKAADSLKSSEIIEPKKPVTRGLIFDHLVVKDPDAAAASDNGAHSIKVEEGTVQRTLFDNSQIISKFPDMGRIQDIIRTTNGWDVEMLPLYNDFIACTLYENGVATNKVFIVDYKGHFMNSLPKIFLIKGGFIDESEAIHLSDALNLINYLKGVSITQPQEQIVSPEQRKIAKYIVNYGTPLVHERFRNKFESICIDKIIPFIEGAILPQHPDASFTIDTFKDSTHWTLTCTPNVPYRFGESGGSCKSTIYIHANGLDKDGHILVTPTFG